MLLTVMKLHLFYFKECKFNYISFIAWNIALTSMLFQPMLCEIYVDLPMQKCYYPCTQQLQHTGFKQGYTVLYHSAQIA